MNASHTQTPVSNHHELTTASTENKLLLHTLRELGEFVYRPNLGNLGDQVIAYATREYFRRHALPYRERAGQAASFPFVYGGGGAFVPYYDMLPHLAALFRLPCFRRIVILPSSFHRCDALIDLFDERFTVFCREEQSYRYLTGRNKKARILLADDMAFTLDARQAVSAIPQATLADATFQEHIRQLKKCLYVTKEGKRTLLFLRADAESRLNTQNTLRTCKTFDLSGLYNETARDPDRTRFLTHLFLHGIDQADIILTDRLHGAICATLLGKETCLLDNRYGKVAGVYDFSLKNRAHATLLSSPEEFPLAGLHPA